jgi:hypothetical protein
MEGGNRGSNDVRPRERPPFAKALKTAARGLPPELPRASRVPNARRAAADHQDLALAERRDGFREEQRAAAPPPIPAGRGAEAGPPPAELRALVRALPLAIDAPALRNGAPLALSFGRSLGIEVRSAPGGVALVLRADRRLAAVCSEALPELVAALARRGVVVAGAEVRPQRGTPPGRCVDLPPALR